MKEKEKVQVFAVIRIDNSSHTDQDVTIKEILPTMEEATEEVERLNSINEHRGSRYFCQPTRYFPAGKN